MRTSSTVVITGAASGIGFALGLEFSRHGWNVGLIGRQETSLMQERVNALGGEAQIAIADVAKSAQLDEAATKLEGELGPIDVWVNNADLGFCGKYHAAHVRRRGWQVTSSTASFSIGNRFVPGLLDRVAGFVGVVAEQTQREAVVEARDPALFDASNATPGTHGPFHEESRAFSVRWWLQKKPSARIGLALLALAFARAAERRL